MKDLSYINRYRVQLPGYGIGDEKNGAFMFKYKRRKLLIIASNGMGWEHVSVSSKTTPTWEEMCVIKDLFFEPEEVVMQLHPKKSEYINNCKTCLHLWKPINEKIPTPPSILVGIKELNDEMV